MQRRRYRTPPIDKRLWAKVEKTETCWLWRGYVMPNGYGQIAGGGNSGARLVHRVAYELEVGPIPEGLVIDHLCRVRHCVRPDHLEAVTQRENLLRGETVTAANAAKVHCPQGHPYSAENTDRRNGARFCRRCAAEYVR